MELSWVFLVLSMTISIGSCKADSCCNVEKTLADIRWAHAVNNKKLLEEALACKFWTFRLF